MCGHLTDKSNIRDASDTNISWPIRTLSFSYDGVYLASGSEDSAIDIVFVHFHGVD